MILNHNFREKLAWEHEKQNGWKQFVGNHFAWQALPVTACLSEQDRPAAFFPRLSRSAGNRRRFVQLAFNLPVVGTSSRQPGIEAAAKGRIAPSGNAENADLVLVLAAAAAGVLWI